MVNRTRYRNELGQIDGGTIPTMVERYRKRGKLGPIDAGLYMPPENLIFDVDMKTTAQPFNIAVNGYGGTSYDWNISIDGLADTRYTGNKSTTPISISLAVGKHTVEIKPYGTRAAGRARCIGNGTGTNRWNVGTTDVTFALRYIPGYAFMSSETTVGNNFLYFARYGCTSLTSMPSGFNLPQGITTLGNSFLHGTWQNCASLTSIPEGFNLPQGITTVGYSFLDSARYGCASLTSMPSGFNLPQGITTVGSNFLYYTRCSCTSLTSIPVGFQLPQGITTVGSSFLGYTRYGCTSLTSDAPNEALIFPFAGTGTFLGTCPITPDSPAQGASVLVKRS